MGAFYMPQRKGGINFTPTQLKTQRSVQTQNICQRRRKNTERGKNMEENNTNTVDTQGEVQPTEGEEEAPTIDSLMAKIAELETKNERDKKALDKALKEKGDITKQYRSVLDEKQKAALDKAEEDEKQKQYVADLEAFKRKTEAKERYLMQGMTAELAKEAAEAEVTGDMDKLADIQKRHSEALVKQAEAKWKESRPEVNLGGGEAPTMTKEQIFAIKDRAERQRAIQANMALFN